MRTGFVTTAQFGARMCGLEFGEEFEHVIMLPADDPVTADLDRIRWCQTDGDGIGVNIKTGEQDGPWVGAGGRPRTTVVVVLLAVLGRDWRAGFCDSTGLGWRSMYVFMVFAFRFHCCLGRESHNLWLGNPLHGSQPTFTPESRHRFHFHRQPYCLGITRTP